MPQRHASFPTHCSRLIREDYRKTRATRSLRATPFGPLGTMLPSSLPACSSLRKPRFRLLRAYHHPLAVLSPTAAVQTYRIAARYDRLRTHAACHIRGRDVFSFFEIFKFMPFLLTQINDFLSFRIESCCEVY